MSQEENEDQLAAMRAMLASEDWAEASPQERYDMWCDLGMAHEAPSESLLHQ